METHYFRKIKNQWVNFFDRKERKEPKLGDWVGTVRGHRPREIVDVVVCFRPGRKNVFSHFDVKVT